MSDDKPDRPVRYVVRCQFIRQGAAWTAPKGALAVTLREAGKWEVGDRVLVMWLEPTDV